MPYTLFKSVKSRDYLPGDHNILKGIEGQEKSGEDILVFKPEQLPKLLFHASADLLLVIAIGVIAGLRIAEISRLDWSEVHLAELFIEIEKGKAKTRSCRLVPITDNLAAWFQAYAQEPGESLAA